MLKQFTVVIIFKEIIVFKVAFPKQRQMTSNKAFRIEASIAAARVVEQVT